jgi:hypothetical protein
MIDLRRPLIKPANPGDAESPVRGYASAVPFAARAALAVVSVAVVGCTSSSSDDCTCVVELNGDRRTLACGQTACVGAAVVICAEQDKSDLRGPCTQPPPPEPPGSGSPDAGTGPPDTSCDDLSTFCATSCSRPASVSADCQTTASAGDPPSCAAWQTTNGLLCMP